MRTRGMKTGVRHVLPLNSHGQKMADYGEDNSYVSLDDYDRGEDNSSVSMDEEVKFP